LIKKESNRQDKVLRMISSENYASSAVMEAAGSILSYKYSEGYPALGRWGVMSLGSDRENLL
jgi:glycine hydroxymethyltransferase